MGSSTLSILLFCIISRILRLSTAQTQICYPSGNFTTNSTYGKNRNLILSSLASKVKSNAGFYLDTFGQESDMVYVLGYCRGDLSEESCVNCVNSSSQAIMKNCPNKIASMSFGDKYQCLVGCSDKNVSMVMYPYIILSNTANISINYVNEFDQALLSLAISLVEKASLSPPRSKFATGKKNFAKYENIYALMECTPGIALDGCRDCLQQLVDDYQTCCMRRKGVVIVGPSCIFQYEMYPFFEVTSDPSPNKTINEGNRSRKLRTAIIIAAPVSILIVLIGCAFFRLRKRGNIKGSQTDIPTKGDGKIDLPLFDVVTIAEATNNFSTSNKIGEGGFGPVFKGHHTIGSTIHWTSDSSQEELGEFQTRTS